MESLNFAAALVALSRGYIEASEFLKALEDGELTDGGPFLSNLQERRGASPAAEVAAIARDLQGDRLATRDTDQTVAYHHPEPCDGEATSAGSTCDLGRYQRVRLLAKGGCGQVWVAHDIELRRDVALKGPLGDVDAHPSSRDAIEAEARLIGALEHPSIVPVYGAGLDVTGRPCYAMRLIPDKTLAQAIAEYHSEKLPASAVPVRMLQLLKCFTDVCNAVQCAHARGIVHRDIKPANIVLGDLGEAYLIDWGLAAPIPDGGSADSSQEQRTPAVGGGGIGARTVVGTPLYMSPEQALGDTPSIASDVFALGATLYEIITGYAPYALKEPITSEPKPRLKELLETICRCDFVRPKERGVSIDAALEKICLKAMAKDPRDRFGTARELVQAVENYFVDLPVRHWKRAAKHFEEARLEHPDDPEFKLSLAKVRYSLGVANWGLMRFTEAVEHLNEAKVLYAELIDLAGYDLSRELAGVCLTLSRIEAQRLHRSEALRHYEGAQEWLARHLRLRGREPAPELILQLFEPSDVGFMRFLRQANGGAIDHERRVKEG